MKAITANPENLNRNIKQLFLPSFLEVFLYGIIGMIILAATNYQTLWDYYNGSSDNAREIFNTAIAQNNAQFNNYLSTLLHGRFVNLMFWAVVGCFSYFLIWLGQNIYINLRNDALVDKNFVHPKGYKSSNYWQSVVAYKILLGALVVSSIFYIYLFCAVLLPLISKLLYIALYDLSWLMTPLRLILVAVCLALSIYVLVLLTRLMFRTWRWVTNNF